MTTYAYWALGGFAWGVIGLLMLKYVWKDMHGGLAMLGHDVPSFAILVLIFAIVFWPYPQGFVYVFVIGPMQLWEKTRNWRYKMRTLLRTGKWPKPVKKEDPKRTNFDKVAPAKLSNEEVDALMACVEHYVNWVKNYPNPQDFRYTDAFGESSNMYEEKRRTIAQRLALYMQQPHRAVAEKRAAEATNIKEPRLWHRSQ